MTEKSFGKLCNLSFIKSSHSLYEINKFIYKITNYEVNLMKLILNFIFIRYCKNEKLIYFNRRDLILFITGMDCNELVSYNKVGYVSKDPYKIKEMIHLPCNNNYVYIIKRLKNLIDKLVKYMFIQRKNKNDSEEISNYLKHKIEGEIQFTVFQMYNNNYNIIMPNNDYLYQPQFIPKVIPLIQKWYHQQFPNTDNIRVNIISNKLLKYFHYVL